MVRRVDFDGCAGCCRLDRVGVGAGGVGTAAEDDGLWVELYAEAGGGGEDAVHANAGRCGGSFVAAEDGFEEIGLHGLDAYGRALGGEVDGGAGGALGGEVGVAGCGCAGDIRGGGVGGGGVVLAVALVGELGLVVAAGLALTDGFVGGGLGGFGVAGGGAARGVAGGDYAVDGDGAGRSGDGVIGVEGEDERLRLGVDGDDGVAGFEVEGVGLLIG